MLNLNLENSNSNWPRNAWSPGTILNLIKNRDNSNLNDLISLVWEMNLLHKEMLVDKWLTSIDRLPNKFCRDRLKLLPKSTWSNSKTQTVAEANLAESTLQRTLFKISTSTILVKALEQVEMCHSSRQMWVWECQSYRDQRCQANIYDLIQSSKHLATFSKTSSPWALSTLLLSRMEKIIGTITEAQWPNHLTFQKALSKVTFSVRRQLK
jgi:hypothetical protein